MKTAIDTESDRTDGAALETSPVGPDFIHPLDAQRDAGPNQASSA